MLLTRPYPVPEHEVSRLAELHSYKVLDTPMERSYDSAVALARETFGVEASVISLIDDDRQWFKAKAGISEIQTDRAYAFCTYAILSNAVMVVPNAAEDPRFRANPLVTGRPHIRFYAGAPLTSPNGLNLGTICLIDPNARYGFTVADQKQLAYLAKFVMAELSKRVASDERRSNRRYKTGFQGIISSYILNPTMVDVEDLSLKGALARCGDCNLGKGEEVILTLGKIVVVATVAWARDDLIGLSFHKPLSVNDVISLGRNIKMSAMELPFGRA